MSWEKIVQNLELKDDIYFARENSAISYPGEANDACFSVEDNSFWFKHRAQCITQAVKNFPPAGEIYDIGGGNGHVALALETHGFKTVLVEPGIQGILNAKHRGLTRLVCAALDSAGFPEHSLPAVGLFDVLEHVREDGKVLDSLKRALSAGGMLYLTVPAYQFLWSHEDEYAGHFRRYTLSSLERLSRKAGFKVVYATYFFSFLPVGIFFLRSLSYRLKLKGQKPLDNLSSEHTLGRGLLGKTVEKALKWELDLIRTKKKIISGGSLLMVLQAL
jgi:SAM-dependent methyltransferase